MTIPRPSSPTPSSAIVIGSGTSVVADTVPANAAVNGAIVDPRIDNVGSKLLNPRDSALGSFKSIAGMIDEERVRVSGGSFAFTTNPGPPKAPNAASENDPLRMLVPVHPAPVEMQKLPSKCWITAPRTVVAASLDTALNVRNAVAGGEPEISEPILIDASVMASDVWVSAPFTVAMTVLELLVCDMVMMLAAFADPTRPTSASPASKLRICFP